MKISKIIVLCALLLSISNAQNLMQESMAKMENGMSLIQKGFLNNDLKSIESGIKSVKEGNALFSKEEVIKEYLPENKKHMLNVATNAAQRITLSATVLELNLKEKAYINATNAYSDMLNACARCHAIVRSW